jgi:thiol-disulfide isomerase/thioredoxin
MKSRFVLLVAVAALSIFGCQKERAATEPQARAGSETPAAAPAAESARPAAMPAYKARTLDGKEFDLGSTRGQVVLLNLWATWCPPCRQEIPELIKLHDTYGPRGFQVIGVSLDAAESVKEVAPMVAERKINYPILLDPDGKIADIFETNVLPTSALVDKQGNIVWTRIGTLEADEKEVVAAIEKALGGTS